MNQTAKPALPNKTKKKSIGPSKRKNKTSKIICALEQDQIKRHGDVASSASSGYSSNSSSSPFQSSTSSISTTSASVATRYPDDGNVRRMELGMDTSCRVGSPLSTVLPPQLQKHQKRKSTDHFLEGLLVLAPNSMDTLDDLMHLDPFNVR